MTIEDSCKELKSLHDQLLKDKEKAKQFGRKCDEWFEQCRQRALERKNNG